MPKRVSTVSVNLVLEVNGTRYRCVSAATNFFVNRIPFANVSLAVGRDARTLERAAIHNNAKDFTKLQPAQLWFKATGEWSPDDDGYSPGAGRWNEAGEQLIFDGYITGFGYRKQHGTVRPSVSLIHWISDLSFSSALSNQSHPNNPVKFRWRAVRGGQGVENDARTHFIHTTVSDTLFLRDKIQKDLWGSSLHPFFCQLSEQDILKSNAEGDECVGLDRPNTDSQKALARFEIGYSKTEVVGKTCEEGSQSPFWKPLQFGRLENSPAAIAGIIAKTIAADIRRGAEEQYFGTTLWDKLVGEFGPTYAFGVIPKVQTAQVVPLVPGLRPTFDSEFSNGKVLDMKDVSYVDTNSYVPRPLRGVGVLQGGLTSQTGIPEFSALRSLGGCYAPDVEAIGMMMYKQPPTWLAAVPFYANDIKNTAFDRAFLASATTPRAPQVLGADQETTNTALDKLQNYYKDAAQYMYAQEMLRGRAAMVQTKLRFDLCPGSNIAIRNQDPLFVPDDQLSRDLVADISRVGISIDAESQTAGTVFQLEHVRSAEENENDRTSVAKHPLYDTMFTGAPLVNDLLFPE
jgi:hypothetical protein